MGDVHFRRMAKDEVAVEMTGLLFAWDQATAGIILDGLIAGSRASHDI